MYRKAHRHLHDNQRYMGNITGILVTYSGMLTQVFRNSWEQGTMWMMADNMDRQVTDDDVMSESHKSIAQMNRTNESHKTR